MASKWFYQSMGQRVGPVSSAYLRELAQRGAITPDTPISTAPDGDWVPAERVRGLFPISNAMPPPIEFRAVESLATEDRRPNARARTKEAFDCPNCGSGQTQKVSVVWESGTTMSKSSSLGSAVAYAGGEFIPAIGGVSTKTRQQSSLAARLAPPETPKQLPVAATCSRSTARAYYLIAAAIAFGGVLVGVLRAWLSEPLVRGHRGDLVGESMAIGIVCCLFGIGIAGVASVGVQNLPLAEEQRARNAAMLKDYEERLEDWRRSYFCHRCGNVFMPEGE